MTPLIKLSNEILNYSIGKFFINFMMNHSINNNDNIKNYNISNLLLKTDQKELKCNHKLNKDISRVFIKNGSSILFEFEEFSKNKILPIFISMKIKIFMKN